MAPKGARRAISFFHEAKRILFGKSLAVLHFGKLFTVLPDNLWGDTYI